MEFTKKYPTFDVPKNDGFMIQEFRVSNFLSFRDETVLSFEPVRDGRRSKDRGKGKGKDNLVHRVNDKTELLRLAIFYGANASGKTNILKAISFLVSFCKKRDAKANAPTGVTPFMLNSNTRNLPSCFNIRFFVDGIRYWYSLELDSKKVIFEALYVYKNNSPQPTSVFKRTHNTLEFNASENTISSTAKELLQLYCLSNLPFFASKAKVNIQLNYVDPVMEFFEDSFMDSEIENDILFTAAEQFVSTAPEVKEHLLSFLKEADFNISGITSQKEEVIIPDNLRNAILSDSSTPNPIKEQLKGRSSFNKIKTMFTHKVNNNGVWEEYEFSSQEQSLGTRRIFGLESYLYIMEEANNVAILDEIDSSLHPDLVDFVLSRFANCRDSESQLIITTHYTGLFDNSDLRDDCFWITEKDKTGASSIRSVGKIKDVRLTSKEKGYRLGKLGGTPKIESESAVVPEEMRELTLFDQ